MEAEKFISELLKENLKQAFIIYGIEGTEQKIKELYKGNFLELLLKAYNELIKSK